MAGLLDLFRPSQAFAQQPGMPSQRSDQMLSFGLGLLSGGTPQEQVGKAASNLVNERRLNKTMEWFKANDPEMAQAVEQGLLNPADAFKISYQRRLEAQGPKKPNLMGAGGSIYNADTGEWLSPPPGSGSDAELGLNLTYGRDANGRTIAFQPSKAGGLVQVDLPEGVQLSDPYTKAYETATGKAGGEATAALPQVEEAANNMLSTIDSLANDPYLESMVGSVQGRLPNLSSDAARVQSKMDQVGGQSFLQAFNSLRGAGQITEIEGQRATAALARLNTAQDEKDYLDALSELRGIVINGMARARQKTSTGAPTPAAPSNRVRVYNPKTGLLD